VSNAERFDSQIDRRKLRDPNFRGRERRKMRKSDIRKQMDALVAGNVRKGETTAQTELRLARENNPEYDRLYNDMCRSDPEAPTIAKAETERERAERIVVRNGRLRGMEGPDSLVLSKVLAEDPDYHSIVVGASATKTVPPPDPTVPRPGEDTSTAAGSVAYYKRLNGD
jgi:hypothetical protein